MLRYEHIITNIVMRHISLSRVGGLGGGRCCVYLDQERMGSDKFIPDYVGILNVIKWSFYCTRYNRFDVCYIATH